MGDSCYFCLFVLMGCVVLFVFVFVFVFLFCFEIAMFDIPVKCL